MKWNKEIELLNQTNENQDVYVYSSLEAALDDNFSWFGEYFWVCAFFPISVIGFFLNLLSFIIFCKKEFNIKLYTYFRVLTFTSIIIMLVALPYPFSMSKRLGFINNFAYQAWQCYFYIPIVNTLFYYANVIEIIIQIDRLATFKLKLKAIYAKIKPHFLCIISFCICLIINFPYFFVFEPVEISLNYFGPNNTINSYKLYDTDTSKFAVSTAGQILTYSIYFIRDFVVLVLTIILNTLNLFYLKKHFQKKSKMVKRSNNYQAQSSQHDQSPTETSNISQLRLSSNHIAENRKKAKEVDANRKISIMVALICLLTSLSNMLMMASIIYFYFYSDATANIFGQIAEFFLIFRFFFNFFFFFFLSLNCFFFKRNKKFLK